MPATALALAAAVGATWPARGGADADRGQPQQTPVNPLDITGKDFAGFRWQEPAREGRLEFASVRATVWTVGTGPGAVSRMFLEGDVRARIGALECSAARAVVWVQRVDAGDFQFFIYFDRLSMPTAAPDSTSKINLSGDRVPVKGVLRSAEGLRLTADKLQPGPADDPLVREAERALAAYLRNPASPGLAFPEPGARAPGTNIPPELSRPYSAAPEWPPGPSLAELEQGFPPAVQGQPIFARQGVISISFGQGGGTLVASEEDGDGVIEFDQGIVVQYSDRGRDRALQLTAQRGVVYLRPELISGVGEGRASFDVSDVRGFYLEGDVVADSTERSPGGLESHYSVRAPRAYYDVQNDRAILLDAVFWTYDQKVGLPLYLRAKTIRQESASQFAAGSARLTNTGFVQPFLSLGVGSVTVTRKDPPPDSPADAQSYWLADATNLTGRMAGVPVLYWPKYIGDPTRFPLRQLSFGDSYGSGPAITSAWDALSLLGIEPPPGAKANLLMDYYFQRGFGLGAALGLQRPDENGDFLAYVLPYDTGTDRLSTGARIEHDGDTRDVIVGEYQKRLDEKWTLQFEGSYFSDPTVVDTFFREDGRQRREFANSAYLARDDEDSALSLDVKGSFNDFTPNQYLLQNQGYTVDRLPEATYTRLNDDLLPGAAPGLLAYSSEYRVGNLGLNFTEPTASELGFTTRGRSQPALGLLPNQSPADRLRAQGYTEANIFRFDTRQEVSSQLRAGPINVVPFAVGRLTVYDTDFSEFNSSNGDNARTWGAAGTRFATEIQKVDDSVESRFFDLHRMRHIIEPAVTLWYAGTNIDQGNLPVYDPNVESIADGAAMMIGAHQTWQTQRGAPGRYRSVDVLTLDTDFQFSSEDSEPESPVGRWFDYRPEYSNMGDFFTADSTWQATEAMALSGRTVFDLSRNRQAATSGGIGIQHTPEFRTALEVLYLAVEHSTYLNFGAGYDVTDKHSLAGVVVYDTDLGRLQQISVEVLRRFPNVLFGISVGYNQISDDLSFGFTLQPVGVESGGARVRGLGGAGGQTTIVGQ
jgi:hypothetical protein